MTAKPSLTRRSSGILLHPSSLAGPRGAGTLGAEALAFVDFLADCGQTWWQVLPVCPPDGFGSPYASSSAFAGSLELVSTDMLAAQGLLRKADLGQAKTKALRVALARLTRRGPRFEREDFAAFREREKAWLEDHCLFHALKDAHEGRSWTEWDPGLRQRRPEAMDAVRARLGEELTFHAFAQWVFARQWNAVRLHAGTRGIGLIGDAPLYVSHESADCWAHQELFSLGADGRPTSVAGVPPDYFSKTGQLWGNPLYRWDRHAETGFAWWLARLKSCAARFDAVRLDHFIGFRNYWEIPAGETTAVNGSWVQAPGEALFDAVRREIPDLQIVAEDLGSLTPEVAALRDKFAFPGMKLAQFSFGGDPKDWPEHWPENCVGYTGTHDNDTSRGWWEDDGSDNALRPPEAADRERESFLRARGPADEPASWSMLRLTWASPARVAIAPLQDLLDLPGVARMNRPGTIIERNWRWRHEPGALTPSLSGRLGALTGACGRAR